MFNLKSGFLAAYWRDYMESVHFFLPRVLKETFDPPYYVNVCFGVITGFRIFFSQKLNATS